MLSTLKSKQLKKKVEQLEKSQSELEILNEKRKKIDKNQSICKIFTKERRDLIEYNSKLQIEVNSFIHDLQSIRRNNENLHQESLKLAKQASDMSAQTILYKKEQQELVKDIEKLQKEISLAAKARIVKEDEYFAECERLEISEEKVNGINKTLKNLENLKNQEVENSRKTLKEIKRVQREINKLKQLRHV